jgi:transcriptional regulator with XRE-family HTH domain
MGRGGRSYLDGEAMAAAETSTEWLADAEAAATGPYSFAARLDMLFDKIRHPVERTRGGAPRKWKQVELAEAIGVTEAYVSKLRRGGECNPALDLIRRIAKFFNVSAAVLVDDDPIAIEYITAQVTLYSALLNNEIDVADLARMLSAPAADQPMVLRELLRTKQIADAAPVLDHDTLRRDGRPEMPATVLFRAPPTMSSDESD